MRTTTINNNKSSCISSSDECHHCDGTMYVQQGLMSVRCPYC